MWKKMFSFVLEIDLHNTGISDRMSFENISQRELIHLSPNETSEPIFSLLLRNVYFFFNAEKFSQVWSSFMFHIILQT